MKSKILKFLTLAAALCGATAWGTTVAKVGETEYTDLAEAIMAALAANDNVPVELLSNIDLTGKTWTSVVYSGGKLAIDGQGFMVKGLSAPLLNKQGSGGHELTMSNVTFKDATVSSTDDYAAVIVPYADSMNKLSFTNVTIDQAQVTSSKYAGAFVGYAAGYNVQNDGPVFQQVTFDNCTVKNSKITGAGSTGALMGHAAGNPNAKIIVRNGTTVQSNVITCSDTSSTDKAGSLFGTVGDCGKGYPEGGIEVAATVSGNTVTSGSTTITTIYGRRGSEGLLKLLPGGSYDAAPINASDTWATVADGYAVVQGANNLWGVVEAVAKIGETTYTTLADAIKAVQNGQTIVVNAGEYTLNGSQTDYKDKAFTIQAAEGATVSFDMSAAVTLSNAKITFSRVTFDYKTNGNYIGLQHADTLVYNDCTVMGQVSLYAASETFNRCTFNQTSANGYNVWTYGAKAVTFNSCTFKCAGKSVLVYNEGYNPKTELAVSACTFTASAQAAGKAAIEIDTSLMAGGATITIDAATTATGFGSGNVSGNSLWNNKMGNSTDANNDITVVVDGKTVLAPVTFVAKIGNVGYTTLQAAVEAAQDGDTVKIVKAGTYKVPTGKNITITGAVDGVVFENIGAHNMGGASMTFNNVTFDYYPNVNYTGLQHSGDLVYNNCTFNGQVFLYGASETFNNCTFNQNSADAYNVWTYTADVVNFNECTFNSAGKSVLVYNENSAEFNTVNVAKCKFIASAPVDGKAAIEMDSSRTAGINLTIDAATTATNFGSGNVSGNSLWNNKMGNSTDANNDITVVVNNETVLAPVTFVAKIGNGGYTTLQAAFDAAQDGDTVKIVKAGTYKVPTGKNITITGAVDGVVFENIGAHNMGGASMTFNNVTFDYYPNVNYTGLQHSGNLVYNNCTFNGQVFLYGASETFNGCTFNQTSANGYNVWTYGAKAVTFNDCTFNCLGKSVLVYNEGSISQTELAVSNCKFKASAPAEGKAAIEIDTSLMAGGATITIDAETTAEGFAKGSNSDSRLWNDKKQTQDTNTNTTVTVAGVTVFAPIVAKIGERGYTTLAAAFAALSAENHKLTLLNENAWNAATPVYWAAGAKNGYVATLTAALTAAYKANADAITIVCRPGADVGTMTHGHVADNLTIYGNNAYLSGGECDLEVDTYKFSRATGALATDGVCLDKDITITAYELDNLGVWGQRNTDHTVTINLTDCDGKDPAGNLQRVYISGTTGVNNITLTDCDFLTEATAVYSNADGAIKAVRCSFTGGQVPFNINHKANGTQTVAVESCTFTNCGDNGDWKQFAAPLRLVNSGSGTLSAVVTGCTFTDTVGSNGDILLGDGRKDQASNNVALKVSDTLASIQAQKPGYYVGETVDATKKATATSPATGKLETSVAQLLPVDPRTLGYATSGNAEALPAPPNMNGEVVNVTAAQAQYVLDGAYGPIDGKTINFTESINDTLILGRASKYDGSKTVYRHGSHTGEALSYAEFIAYKNQSVWTESCYYERTVENVTFTANKGVTVKNFEADGGAHIYAGAGTAPVYDYVRDTGLWVTEGSCYFKRAILKNITFKGLTFKAKTDINTSESTTVYDGFTFKDCTFDLGTTVGGNQAIRYYNENNNGNVKNLVVEGCTFKTCYQGVYTAHVKNVTVKDCTFDTTGHNAIAIQDNNGPCDHGAVVITGNKMVNIGDRAIRFNVVAAGTTITITRNTAAYKDGTTATDKECIKAETLAAGVTTTVELNNWNNYAVAANKPLTETVAKIDTTDYKSLEDATKAAKNGDVITIVGYTSNMTAPDGWKFETVDGVTTLVADPVLVKGEDGKFHIASYDDLLLFKKMVNEKGMNFSGETVVLDANINMASEENWTPIGNASEKKFAGTFDGQNHTIRGLKITGGSYVGLFGYLGAATVQNVALVGANVSGVKRVGALVGQIAGDATIKNCSLDTTSSVTGSDSNTGGLIGEASGSIVVTLENLTNNAPVTNTESGTSRAAGILCQATSGASVTLKNCVNNGTITTNGGYAGGIVSAKQGGASLVFDGCSNTGTLANGTKGTGALLAWSCNGSSVTISNYSGDVANAIGWLDQDNYDHVFVINGVEHYIRVAKSGSGYTFASRYEAAQLMDKSYLQEIIGFFNYAKTVNANFEGYPATPVEVLKSAYNTRDESIKGGLFNTDVSSGWPQLLSQYNATSGKSLTADDFAVTWGTRDVLFKIGDAVAKIGNSYYATLAAALIGAKSGDTIQILAGTWGEDAIGKLDEEGKYTNANIVRYKSLTIQPAEGAEVTFTSTLSLGYDDSSTANATMTVKNLNFDGASLKLSNYVQATVEGCTFKNGTSSTSGTLIVQDACCINHKTADTYPTSQVTIKNCTIDGSNDGASAIRIRNSGNVTITGNTIKNSKFNGILMESNNSVDNSVAKSIVITGNTITEWNAANVAEGGRAMRLALGTLAAESTVFVANNVFRKATTGLDSPDFAKITGVGAATVSLDGNDWNDELRSTVSGNTAYYTVDTTSPVLLAGVVTTKHEPVAQVTVNGVTTKYTTFEDALAAANAATDATITLLDDVAYATNGSGLWNITSSMTLDGGGHALNGYGTRSGNKTTLAINNGGSAMVAVTLKNLTIRNEGPAGRPIETRGNISSLTLENCEVTATGSGNNQGITIGGNQSSAAKVVLKNTTVDAGRSGYPYISFNPAAVEISGGTLSGYCGMYFKGVNESTGSQGTVVTATGTKFDCPNVHEEGLNDFGVFVLEDDGITINLTDCRVNSAVQGTARQAVVMTKDNAQRRTQPCSISIAGSETHVNGELMDNVWDKGPVVSVSGGTFTHAIDETYCAAGFIPTANADGTYGVKEGSYVAQIGETKYETLAEAVQAAKSGDTVVLLKNCAGDGVVVSADKNITIDFAGYTYTVDGATVGSAGTETSGFQLLKGATVTLKGGTLTSTKAKILIQNYANLTLLDMTVTGGTATQYVVSNNCGAMNVLGGTSITATTGNRAFDVCATQHYPDGVTVKIDTTGTITGIIEYDVWGSKPAENKATLEIVNGTFVGTWNVESALAEDAKTNLNVSGGTFSVAVPEDYCAEGYIPTANADGTYGVKEGSYVAQIGETKYETLAEAVQAAKSGDTVVLLKNCAGDGIKIPSGSNLTVDFRGFTYTVDGTTVGSAGTETQAFQLLQDSTITFRNGTIKSTTAQMLIQNYANLTLDQMVLDGSKLIGSKPYTLSTNNGVTKIKDSTITAAEGGIAFDACCWEPYTSNSVELLGASVVNGDIEVSSYHDRIPTLTLTAGTVNGNLVMSDGADKAVVSKADAVTLAAPADYKWNDEGLLVPKVYVAQIGETKYETLQEAVGAAAAGATITMIADEDVKQTIYVNKQVTIDLNGKKLSNSEDIWDSSVYDWSLISVRSGANLTITGNGTLDAKENDCYAIDVRDYDAKVTVLNGTFVGNVSAVYVWGGELNIQGGSFDIKQHSDSDKPYRFLINCLDENFKNGSAKVSISGGTFKGFNPKDNVAEGTGTNFCAPNYTGVEIETGVWTVIKEQSNTLTAVVDSQMSLVVKVPESVLYGKYEELDGETVTDKKNAYINKEEANGLKVWQNYVMGVDGSDEGNELLTDYVVGGGEGEGEWITVKTPIAAFNPPTDSGITVKYRLLRTMTPDDATSWQAFGELKDTPSFPVDIAGQEGDTFWKIEVVFQGEAANE